VASTVATSAVLVNPGGTMSGGIIAHATSLSGVNQSTPETDTGTGTGTGTASTAPVTSGASDLVLEVGGWGGLNNATMSNPINTGTNTTDYINTINRSFGLPDWGAGFAHGSDSTPTWGFTDSHPWAAAAVAVASDSPGATTQPVGGTGEGTVGDDDGTYVGPAHVHEHGLLSTSDTHHHDTTQIEGYAAGTDHGDLAGLGDDDHTNLLNETRHDALDHTGLTGVGSGGGGGAYAETIGDGAATSFQVTHDLGTEDVIVQLYDLTGTDPVEATADASSITVDDENHVTVVFGSAPGTDDYRVIVLASGGSAAGHILSRVAYNPGTQATYTTTSATFADVDGTNLLLPAFTVPASGEVQVEAMLLAHTGDIGTTLDLNLRDGSGSIAGSGARVSQGAALHRAHAVLLVSGLTPGATATGWKLGFARVAGSSTSRLYAGGTIGPAILQVKAV
jgi:hypothetical protein